MDWPEGIYGIDPNTQRMYFLDDFFASLLLTLKHQIVG